MSIIVGVNHVERYKRTLDLQFPQIHRSRNFRTWFKRFAWGTQSIQSHRHSRRSKSISRST